MEKINVLFLGTSSGIPTKDRNHTGILIYYRGDYLLFDCGEGIQRQFKKAKISPSKVNKIFITHLHADHILGLAGLFQTIAMNAPQKKLEIYGPKGLGKYIESLIIFFPIIKKINLMIKELKKDKEIIYFQHFIIEAIKVEHTVTVYAYQFKEKDKIKIKKKYVSIFGGPSPLFKKLIEGKTIYYKGKKISPRDSTYKVNGRKITIVLDTRKSKNIFYISKNVDLLIIECVYKEELQDIAKDYFHLTTKDVAEIIKKSKPNLTVITHISERYHGKEGELLKEIKKKTKRRVMLAYDFLSLHL